MHQRHARFDIFAVITVNHMPHPRLTLVNFIDMNDEFTALGHSNSQSGRTVSINIGRSFNEAYSKAMSKLENVTAWNAIISMTYYVERLDYSLKSNSREHVKTG